MRSQLLLVCILLNGCSDGAQQISASGFGAFEPALAVAGDGIVVTWNDNRHGNDEVYLRKLGSSLRPSTPERRLTTSRAAAYETAVAVLADATVVTWYQKAADGELAVMLGMWTADGRLAWQQRVSSAGVNGRVPALDTAGEQIFLTWIEEARTDASGASPASAARATSSAAATSPTVYGAWFDASGAMTAAPTAIAQASRTTWKLDAAILPDGSAAVIFDSDQRTRSSELLLFHVSAGAAREYRLTVDDGFASKYPDLAIGVDSAALAWHDASTGNNEIYLHVFDLQSFLAGTYVSDYDDATIEAGARRVTFTEGDSIGAYLAWNGPTLGLAWNDDEPGQHEIYFQTFDAQGQPLQHSARVTHSTTASLIPAIAAYRGGFVLGWNEALLGSSHVDSGGETRSEILLRYIE